MWVTKADHMQISLPRRHEQCCCQHRDVSELGTASEYCRLQDVCFKVRTVPKQAKADSSCRSHGNVSHHLQISLNPVIDAQKFRVFSGFGQQLGPIVYFKAAGVVDGLAAIYPKAVVRLMKLSEQRPLSQEALDEAQALQFASSRASEVIVTWGILGIREGIYRVLGMGHLEGGRVPLRGGLPEGEWEKLKGLYESIAEMENSL